MTFEKIISNANYNIQKILEELREKIKENSDIDEVIDNRQIMYQHDGEDFCVIKVKKDHIEIDFLADNAIEDPMEFSWKIRPTRKSEFNGRMHIKNIVDIDIVLGLIFQSYKSMK